MSINFPKGTLVELVFNVKNPDYLYRALESINAKTSDYNIFINGKYVSEDYYINSGDKITISSKKGKIQK